MEKILQFAFAAGRPVVIMYQGKTGISRRKVRIKKMENGKIHGYCYLREKDRVFLLENILSVQLEEKDNEVNHAGF